MSSVLRCIINTHLTMTIHFEKYVASINIGVEYNGLWIVNQAGNNILSSSVTAQPVLL